MWLKGSRKMVYETESNLDTKMISVCKNNKNVSI